MEEERNIRKAEEPSNGSTKPVTSKKMRVPSLASSFFALLFPSSSLSPPSVPSSSLSPPSVPSSSLSVPSSSRSSLSHNWIHDVFTSFRGEDVRKDFFSHLQKEFERKKITQFIDNEIKRGESIGPELIRGIRGSKIAIILLSKNYASSKWCLKELVEIMECREKLGQIVMTIFYKVDPSEVKNLAGDFGNVFRRTCVGQSEENIGRWKQALEKVATIAGYPSNTWNTEADLIEKISGDVLDKLFIPAPSSDSVGLVGMRVHMRKMQPLLRLKSNEVRMIGIWGPSGIGKTTIARALFEQYSNEFQISVFMENIGVYLIRGAGSDDYSAKLKLQAHFISRITNQVIRCLPPLGSVYDLLKDKKVFVVLDAVLSLVELEAIARETTWFGPGSRIIITAQDIGLFRAHGINLVYEVDFPPDDEALEIFCMYAFDQNSPPEGFEYLAQEITKLAGKLPLSLRVMGSYLRRMSKQDWTMELPRLRTLLDGKIGSILRLSYDALDFEQRDLFLHIACLFNNEQVEKVEAHLLNTFPYVTQELNLLTRKSLISISSGYIKMHEMLVRLGRQIVRRQSTYKPCQRQFLVDARDACEVLSDHTKGNINVIGIDSKYSEIKDALNRSERAFEEMPSLQFLRLHGNEIHPRLPQSSKYLPQKVRLLHWESFPMTCLPPNYNPEFLVELNMSNSRLARLWKGVCTIRNLKWMNLSNSINLKELPDLSTATNLKELNMRGCSNLLELPDSIGYAKNLMELDLEGCSSLVELPSSLGDVTKLSQLYLRSCSSLVELPFSIGNITSLKNLVLSQCSSLVGIPSSIGNITGLKNLILAQCTSLDELPSSVGNISGLKNLNLSECSSLVELPSSIGNITSLESLYLNGCSKLEALPSNINLEYLNVLNLADCSLLQTFPEISTNIEHLMLNGTAIQEVPTSIESWSRLDDLHMSYNGNLKEFPHAFDCITELHLSDTRIQEIGPWIKQISCLRLLVLKGCTSLVSLPQLPESLAFIDAENCESLEKVDSSFHTTKFIGLNFVNCFKLNQEAKDLIIKTSTSRFALFPGETVPTYFTYRARGSSLSMKWNGIDTQLPSSLRYKACVSLVKKGEFELGGDGKILGISYCIKEKENGNNVKRRSRRYHHRSPLLKEHLYTFEVEEEVSSSELVIEFEVCDKNWEIGECGLNFVPTLWVPC